MKSPRALFAWTIAVVASLLPWSNVIGQGPPSSANNAAIYEKPVLTAKRKEMQWRTRGIIYNNDGNGIFHDTANTPDGLLARRMNAVPGTTVGSVFFCTGATTMFTHQAKVGEVYGKYISAGNGPVQAIANIKALAERGTDTLATVTKFCHTHDLEIFFTYRINDIHDCFLDWEFSTWKRKHPGYLMGKRADWGRFPEIDPRRRWAALDFEIPQVREYLLAIVDDVLARYDVDGIEIDYLRNPLFFRPNRDRRPVTPAQVKMLTGFQRKIRQLAYRHGNRRGRPILVATRVPVTTRMGLYCGIDVKHWLQEGLLDVLTTAVGCMPYTNPTRQLVKLGHAHHVPVYPSIAGSGRTEHQSIEHWRGAAANFWHAGADGMVVFNHFPQKPSQQFKELGARTKLARLNKIFALDNQAIGDGGINHTIRKPPVPLLLNAKKPRCQLTLPVGDNIAKAAQDGALKSAVLRMRITGVDQDRPAYTTLHVSLNGEAIKPKNDHGQAGWMTYVTEPLRFRHGDNNVVIGYTKTANTDKPITIEAVELRVDYR